jgi:hypothetical protein
MKTLPMEFRHEGRLLRQLKRSATSAIYQLFGTGEISYGYEVIRIKQQKAAEKFGRILPSREIYPASSWFGTRGWSFGRNHLRQALEKFDSLVQAEVERLSPPASRHAVGLLEDVLAGGVD